MTYIVPDGERCPPVKWRILALYERRPAARLGGDEFVVLIPGVADESAAALVCERRLRAVTAAPFMYEHHVIPFPRDGDDLRTLLARADDALYVAKRAGKDQWTLGRPP